MSRLLLPNDKFPNIGESEHLRASERLIVAKFFASWSDTVWYALEFDGKDRFYGLVREFNETRFGYFKLSGLESIRGFAGLVVERDTNFKTHYLSEAMGQKL